MFSEIQRNFIEKFVLANKKEYPYYLAYTKTNVNQQGVYDDYAFYVILSDEPIEATSGYSYSISGNSCRFGVKSANASYNYHTERVVSLSSISQVDVNNYEFIYTNAEFTGVSLQPDLLIPVGVQQSHFDGFSLALLIILAGVLIYKIIRGGGGYAKI